MYSEIITVFFAVSASAGMLPYDDQAIFRAPHDAEKGMSGPLTSQCATSSVQADLFSISQLEIEPEADGDDFLHFTPINSNYEADDAQLSPSTKILLEHKINGREGGVFFEFCDSSTPMQSKVSGECPPEKGDAVAEVLDWLLFEMPAGNYPFRYISETSEGQGQFCINGTTWDNEYNVELAPWDEEIEHVEIEEVESSIEHSEL